MSKLLFVGREERTMKWTNDIDWDGIKRELTPLLKILCHIFVGWMLCKWWYGIG